MRYKSFLSYLLLVVLVLALNLSINIILPGNLIVAFIISFMATMIFNSSNSIKKRAIYETLNQDDVSGMDIDEDEKENLRKVFSTMACNAARQGLYSTEITGTTDLSSENKREIVSSREQEVQ